MFLNTVKLNYQADWVKLIWFHVIWFHLILIESNGIDVHRFEMKLLRLLLLFWRLFWFSFISFFFLPFPSLPSVGKSAATLFFGNLSLSLDEKMLKSEIEMFTGKIFSIFFHISPLPFISWFFCTVLLNSIISFFYFHYLMLFNVKFEKKLIFFLHLETFSNHLHFYYLYFKCKSSYTFLYVPIEFFVKFCFLVASHYFWFFPFNQSGPGSVASVRFPTDKDSQKSKGYAYVDIHRISDAKRVSLHYWLLWSSFPSCFFISFSYLSVSFIFSFFILFLVFRLTLPFYFGFSSFLFLFLTDFWWNARLRNAWKTLQYRWRYTSIDIENGKWKEY